MPNTAKPVQHSWQVTKRPSGRFFASCACGAHLGVWSNEDDARERAAGHLATVVEQEEIHMATVATQCAQCGKSLDHWKAYWDATVNLSTDALIVGSVEDGAFYFVEPVADDDWKPKFDWCDVDCFGAWCYRAAVALESKGRQDA